MRKNHRMYHVLSNWPRAVVAVLVVVAAPNLVAQTTEQILPLQAGWNAVFLEVAPGDATPSAVFAGTPVDIVARYFPRPSSVQYISDPADGPWNEPGWGVWYAPTRPEAIVSSLYAIHGNRAYLVHAASACTWRVAGTVAVHRPRWQADSFNLVGFGLAANTPPTFGAFFAGAQGRIGDRIYRLVDDRWQPVTALDTARMQPGEAYWIYCRGQTAYAGPLELDLPGNGRVDFGSVTTEVRIGLRNHQTTPMRITLAPVASSGAVPLSCEIRDPATLQPAFQRLDSSLACLGIPPGQSGDLRLHLRREAMTAAAQSTLLTIATDAGVQFLVPISARRADLAAQP